MPRGGFRSGAGRKAGVKLLKKATAEEILAHIDEVKKWQEHLECKDKNISLKALMYLTDKRDGKAAQTVLHGDATTDPSARIQRIIDATIGEIAPEASDTTSRPN